MPADRRLYPADWRAVVARVRERSGDRCECSGECGLHTTTGRCVETHRAPAAFARGTVILTTAHLNAPGGPCRCVPLCGDLEHLRHMCQRCHLRYDRALHAASALRRREALFHGR